MNSEPLFTFIDLFAGIGGIRIAFESVGGKCVFSSEYDKFAQQTYRAFFGETPDFSDIMAVDPSGDITKLDPSLVPDHDILTGGFPCQPFSIAGVSKKNSLGRPHGFDDPTQGTLFFNVKGIINEKRPKAFLLENVKNLKNHDKGYTYKVIEKTLKDLNYTIFSNIIDAQYWVPQHRERIYIVGFRNPEADKNKSQTWQVDSFPEFLDMEMPANRLYELDEMVDENPPISSMLTPGTWDTLLRHKKHHEKAGNGFGYGLLTPPLGGKVTRTISARYHKDGAEILIDQGWERPRRLTPLEACRLMGFPEEYQEWFSRIRSETNTMPVSKTQAYRQFGNSVVVPVVAEVAKLVINKLSESGGL